MGNYFLELIEQARKEYKTWKPMYCPALGEQVFFTISGFNHPRFNSSNTSRDSKEVIRRLRLLGHVRSAIRNAHSIVSYRRRLISKGKSIKEMEYWAIEACVGKKEKAIRIVFEKSRGAERIRFLSVMEM